MKTFDGRSTLDEWYQQFIQVYKRDISGKTRNGYDVCYRNVGNELGHMMLKDLTSIDFMEVFNDMNDIGYSKYTIRQTKMVVRMAMTKAVENGLIAKNPVPEIFYGSNEVGKGRALTTEEQQLLLLYIQKVDYSYADLIILLLLTGLRNAEIRALTWDDIDFDNHWIHVTKSVREYMVEGIRVVEVANPKTKKSNRMVPMSDQAKAVLLRYQDKGVGVSLKTFKKYGDLVFSKDGNILKSGDLRYIFFSLIKEMNAEGYKIGDVRPHVLRHTFATRCIESGLSAKFVSEILGHESIRTTMNIYVHPDEEMLSKEMEKMDIIGL